MELPCACQHLTDKKQRYRVVEGLYFDYRGAGYKFREFTSRKPPCQPTRVAKISLGFLPVTVSDSIYDMLIDLVSNY